MCVTEAVKLIKLILIRSANIALQHVKATHSVTKSVFQRKNEIFPEIFRETFSYSGEESESGDHYAGFRGRA